MPSCYLQKGSKTCQPLDLIFLGCPNEAPVNSQLLGAISAASSQNSRAGQRVSASAPPGIVAGWFVLGAVLGIAGCIGSPVASVR